MDDVCIYVLYHILSNRLQNNTTSVYFIVNLDVQSNNYINDSVIFVECTILTYCRQVIINKKM